MSKTAQRATLAVILLLGLALQMSGLDWGLRSLNGFELDGKPVSVMTAGFGADSDALHKAAKSFDDGPFPVIRYGSTLYQFNSYGTVFLYFYRFVTETLATVGGFEAFGDAALAANASRVCGRLVSAMSGVVLIWITWLVGFRLLGPIGALGAALLAAVFPMSIQAGHLATVDGMLGLWFGAALWGCLRVLSEGERRDYIVAGCLVGVATATKINGLFLLLPLGLAHLLRADRPTSLCDALPILTHSGIYIAFGSCVLTWLLLTPAAVFEFSEYFFPKFAGPYHIEHSLTKASESAATHRGWLHLEGVSTYFYQPFHVFPLGIGWVVQVVFVAGLVLAFIRRSQATLLLAISFVVYYLLVARLPDKPIRFFVPMATVFAVLAVYPIVAFTKARNLIMTAVAILAIEPSARAYALVNVYRQPDSRVEAGRWIQENIPQGGKLMLERGHNSLASVVSRHHVSLLPADLENEFANARGDLLSERGHFTACVESEFLSQVDYFAITEERMAIQRVRKAAKDFYDRLFAGELGFELRATFPMRPSIFGLEIEDETTDLNWTRYDHPTTYVFVRTNREPALYSNDPDLSVYRLRTWEDTQKLIVRAQKSRIFMFFKRCLPGPYKERVGEEKLVEHFMAFLKDPASLTGSGTHMTAVLDGETWRIKME